MAAGWRALAAAVAAVAAAAAPEETLQLVSLKLVDPLAVCNDGTPAGYYWKPATTDPSRWIVDMQGGDWCYSRSSCYDRCAWGDGHCTSAHFAAEVQQAGLFRPARDPALEGANKVWIPYCTSDGHMGDGEAFGLHFRGARVVQAVLRDLVERRGLGREEGRHDLVILGGQSAGARGAMVHLDYVVEMLGGDASAPGVDVVGLLDSPLWLDRRPLPGSGFPGFNETCRGVYSFANVTHLGTECAEAYPEADRWRCIMGQYRMPHVKTPYLLVASQYDSYQLEKNVGHRPAAPAEEAYAEDFAHHTAELVRSLRVSWPAPPARQNAVFSWACYTHATTCTGYGFDTGTCAGTTVDVAMREFLGLSPRSSLQEWVDDCQGFACGPGCHVAYYF